MKNQKNKSGIKINMKVSLNDLRNVSREFKAASQETDALMARLNAVVKRLEETWNDAGQEVFYKYYEEWQANISGVSELLNLAANELDAVAERYYKADGDELPQSNT